MENYTTAKEENKDFPLKLQYSYLTTTPQIIVDHSNEAQQESNNTRLCRLCANVADEAKYLFTNNENGQNLADKINSCLPVTVRKNDTLPKHLCSNCIEKLHECFQFSGACISAEKKLMSVTQNSYFINSICSSDVDSNNEDTTSCNNYSCPLCVEGTLNVVHHKTNYCERECSMIHSNVTAHSNGTSHIISNAYYNTRKDDINKSIPKVVIDDDKKITELSVVPHKKRQHILPELKSNFVCRICNKIFYTTEMIQSHCKFHSRYNCLPCVICENVFFINESQLEAHLYNNHLLNCYNVKECTQKSNSNDEIGNSNTEKSNEIVLTDISFSVKLNEEPSPGNFNNSNEFLEGETVLYSGFLVTENKKICEICGMQFTTDAMLLMHMNNAHLSLNDFEGTENIESSMFLNKCEEKKNIVGKLFQCEFCEATFNKLIQLKEHIKQSHTENNPTEMQLCYQCDDCKAIFPQMTHVSEHCSCHEKCEVSSHYIENVFKCEYCDLCFLGKEDLKHHFSQHIGELPYTCLQCNLHFESYYKLREHKNDIHEKTSTTDNSQFIIPMYYLCEFCGMNFEEWQCLYIHRYKSHLHGKSLSNDENVNRPFLNPSSPNSSQSHLCEICGKVFESQNTLSKHRKQEHIQTSKYRCTECGKVLANLTGLIIHRRLHTGEKPFVCDLCGKSFHQSSGMYTHRRTHTRECPYRCEYCDQAYNVKGDLDNHRRAKHTKERPFKCETCQKSFLTSSVFYQHRILHTGVRKYKCMYCEKSFARWNALRLHIRTHTGEKPYICFVCQRGFAQKGDMKKHMKTQHNIHEVIESM